MLLAYEEDYQERWYSNSGSAYFRARVFGTSVFLRQDGPIEKFWKLWAPMRTLLFALAIVRGAFE